MRRDTTGRAAWILLVGVATLFSCTTSSWRRAPHARYFQRVAPPELHALPETRDPSSWWERGWQSFRPLGEAISPGHQLRRLSGGTRALDVNAFGQVPDSSWFVNRINRRELTTLDVSRGPNALDGPAEGDLLVLDGKMEGNTPGLIVRDQRGDRWVIKFDPPAFPEMASGAEMVATKLMHAAGYHVPENYLVSLEITRLELDAEAKTIDSYNRKVPLTHGHIEKFAAQLNPSPEGKVRALFSRYIPGTPVGPFDYMGTRPDDPNDRIPHEHRRSLRALWVFAAWLNNTDTTQIDTFDTFIRPQEGSDLGYLRHYLLDFNASLGSDATWPKPIIAGATYRIDWASAALHLVAFGLYYPYWLAASSSPYRSVGPFEGETFDPARWRPSYPNPAFQRATARDVYWAASILACFTREHVHAAVVSGRFTEPGAADWVEGVLNARREKILRYAFRAVLPLDRPRVDVFNRLRLDDLALDTGILTPPVRYRARVRWNRPGATDREIGSTTISSAMLDLAAYLHEARTRFDRFDESPFLSVRFTREREGKAVGPGFHVHLRVDGARAFPIGISREVD